MFALVGSGFRVALSEIGLTADELDEVIADAECDDCALVMGETFYFGSMGTIATELGADMILNSATAADCVARYAECFPNFPVRTANDFATFVVFAE